MTDASLENHRREAATGGWRYRLMKLLLRHLHDGRLTVVTPDGRAFSYGSPSAERQAVIVLHRWRAVRRFMTGGDVGIGESFVDGDWSSPDLALLVELVASNSETLRKSISGPAVTRAVNLFRHAINRNTRRGSRRNIIAHYDLGNRFYSHWLDRGMVYSSALFTDKSHTLETAQAEKLDTIVAALDLRGGERVAEIGCGWGGLAERIAREGCHVTAITLSPAQLAYARARVEEAGLLDRVTFVLQDYRDLAGTFDRVVSVEMIEAVGRTYLPTFFDRIHKLLKPGGMAVLQAITIADHRLPFYQRSPDFIQRHVFPGGFLPSPLLMKELSRDVGLSMVEHMRFGFSYSRTLAEWARRFREAWPDIQSLGFDDRFHRLWTYYLAYCEGGFRSGAIDVGLYRLSHVAQP